jgi:uncharacterized BrkB/YihY/UPF0761 family membrane protein
VKCGVDMGLLWALLLVIKFCFFSRFCTLTFQLYICCTISTTNVSTIAMQLLISRFRRLNKISANNLTFQVVSLSQNVFLLFC